MPDDIPPPIPDSGATSGPKRRLPRSLMTLVLSLAVLTAAYGGFHYLASLKKPPAVRDVPPKIYNVSVFEVERSDLPEVISAFGTARANHEVVLAAQVSGEIIEVFPGHDGLKIGQLVRAREVRVGSSGQSVRFPGDLLLRIDPKMFQERVVQAQNRLDEDAAELRLLKQQQANNADMLRKAAEDYKTYSTEYERVRELRRRNAASASQLAQSLLQLRKYEDVLIKLRSEQKLFPLRIAQVERRRETHQTDLKLAQLDLDRTEVRPPFTGRLSEVLVEKGQFVRAGDRLVKLADVSAVEIPVAVPLSDFAKIQSRIDAGAPPRVDLADNETAVARWSGSAVRAAPAADELTRTIKVFVHVINTERDDPLLPGTFVNARIRGSVIRGAVAVPRDAIVGGRVFVATQLKPVASDRNSSQVLQGVAHSRKVTVNRTMRSLAIIGSGLQPGDRVILTNLDVIHDGATVRILSRRKLSAESIDRRLRVPGARVTGGDAVRTAD